MEIRAVLEYNQGSSLLWAENFPGACSRGATPEEAEEKLPAEEMYRHTNQVSNYYIGELGAEFENLPDIWQNRVLALQMAESLPDFLQNRVTAGSFGELWSLKKALRRFLWHDLIHARALWRMARRIWPDLPDPFCFGGTD